MLNPTNPALAHATVSLTLPFDGLTKSTILGVKEYKVALTADQRKRAIAKGYRMVEGRTATKSAYGWLLETELTSGAKALDFAEDEIDGMEAPLPDFVAPEDDSDDIALRTVRGAFVEGVVDAVDGLPTTVLFTHSAFGISVDVDLVRVDKFHVVKRNGVAVQNEDAKGVLRSVVTKRSFMRATREIERPNGTTYVLVVKVSPRCIDGINGYVVHATLF